MLSIFESKVGLIFEIAIFPALNTFCFRGLHFYIRDQ